MSPDPFARAVELGREFATSLRRTLAVMGLSDDDVRQMADAGRDGAKAGAAVRDAFTTHYVGDGCSGGHYDDQSCEDFCQERCAWPGRFSECDL